MVNGSKRKFAAFANNSKMYSVRLFAVRLRYKATVCC